MGFRTSAFISILAISLTTSCSGMVETFDRWGESMPTHNDTWCEGWFCWNSTTTKDKALHKNMETGEEARYFPAENQSKQVAPVQIQEGMMGSGEFVGMGGGEIMQPPPGQSDGFSEEEIRNMPPELQEIMREKGMIGQPPPPPPAPGSIKKKQNKTTNSAYPEGMDPNNPPPGAIPGVNWPPPPPEFMNEEDDMNMQHKLPAALDAGDSDNSESDE